MNLENAFTVAVAALVVAGWVLVGITAWLKHRDELPGHSSVTLTA